MIISIATKIKRVEKVKKIVKGTKDQNGQTTLIEEALGWFLFLDGSWEGVKIAGPDEEEPKIRPGQTAKIKIEIDQ